MDSGDRVQRDQLLRMAVLGGDEQAWRTWYEESFDDLYAYVHWRCAGMQDRTDEIIQETWLWAVRRVRQFDPNRGSFSVWLRGIAANVLRARFREEKKRRGRLEPVAVETLQAGGSEKGALHARQIARTLAALPEQYESVLRAKYFDGLSVARIAELEDKTPKAIESLLSRARRTFQQLYQEHNGRPDT